LVLFVTRGRDRLLGLVEVAGVEVPEGGEHLRVEGVGVDAGGAAPVDAVAVASEAGVVAVRAAASVGVGAEVAVAADWTIDLAGEVVVGGCGGLLRGHLAAFGEDVLGQVEGCGLDHRSVGVDGDDVAEADLAEVDAIGEHVGDGLVAPRLGSWLRDRLAVRAAAYQVPLVEVGGDGAAAEPAAGVEAEDQLDDADLVVEGHEAVLAVAGVAVRYGANGPLALGCLALHAIDDPVDDHLTFELGDYLKRLLGCL